MVAKYSLIWPPANNITYSVIYLICLDKKIRDDVILNGGGVFQTTNGAVPIRM